MNSTVLLNGISHSQVPVSNLEESIQWYSMFLGCREKANYGTFAIMEFNNGPDIFLWKTNDNTSSTFTVNGEDFPTVGIDTDNMDNFLRILKQGKTKIIEIPFDDSSNMRFVKFYDPDGNMFVVVQEIQNNM